MGIALGVITNPAINAILIFAIYALNFVLQLVFIPHGDLHVASSDIFTAGTEAAQIGATMMATLGLADSAFMEAAFLIFTALGFLPSLVGTIFQTWNTAYLVFTEKIMGYLAPVIDPIKTTVVDPAMTKAQELKAAAIDYGFGLLQSAKTAVGLGGGEEGEGSKLDVAKGILEENMDMERVDECLPAEEAGAGILVQQEERCAKQAWIDTLRETFNAIDEDGDGSLQRREVQNALKRGVIKATLVRNDVLMSKAMFQKFFDAMDTDHDGEISFEEFTYAVLHSGAFLEGVEAHELLEHLEQTTGPKSFAKKESAMRAYSASLVYANMSAVGPSKPPLYASGLDSAGGLPDSLGLHFRSHVPTPGSGFSPILMSPSLPNRDRAPPVPPSLARPGSPLTHGFGGSSPSAPRSPPVPPSMPHPGSFLARPGPHNESCASPTPNMSYASPDRIAARLHNYYNHNMPQFRGAFLVSPASPTPFAPSYSARSLAGPPASVPPPQTPDLSTQGATQAIPQLPISPSHKLRQFVPLQLSTQPVMMYICPVELLDPEYLVTGYYVYLCVLLTMHGRCSLSFSHSLFLSLSLCELVYMYYSSLHVFFQDIGTSVYIRAFQKQHAADQSANMISMLHWDNVLRLYSIQAPYFTVAMPLHMRIALSHGQVGSNSL